MASLRPYQMRGDASSRSRGYKPGPQRMPGELRRFQTDPTDMPFDQRRDGLAGETISRDGPALTERSEQRSFFNLSSLDPCLYFPHRAPPAPRMGDANATASPLLVGRGPAQGDDQPLPDKFYVGQIEPDQFRPPQSACEADQQQCPVPLIPDAVTGLVEDRPEVLHHQGRGLVLRLAGGLGLCALAAAFATLATV